MGAFQTAMSLNPAVAIEGMIADNGPHDILSRVAAGAVIAPGRAVVYHAADDDSQVRLPGTTGEAAISLGVSVYRAGWPTNPYAVGDMMAIMKYGRIWVTVEEAVTPLSPVFVRFTVNAGTTALGRFRTSADTARAVACPGFRFLTTQATPDGLVLLGVNLPL